MPLTTRLAVTTDARFDLHRPPGFHPARPERRAAALRGLERLDPARRVLVPARPATEAELLRVHTEDHLASLASALTAGTGYLDADTYFSPGTREAAWLAAGGGCALVDALLDGVAPVGALLARPPGHHATRDRAMGFCLLNNVAVAAAHARARGLARVAIVDWDVHHGNGTQDIFEADPDVLFVSLHQLPLYPGSGAATEVGVGDARGRTVNVPLPPGTAGDAHAEAFHRLVLPMLAAFRPELIFISAGFDAHERDPLADLRLRAEDYARMAAQLRAAAQALGHGRVLFVLEGGYDLVALEESTAASLGALLDPDAVLAGLAHKAPSPLVHESIERIAAVQRPYWPGVV